MPLSEGDKCDSIASMYGIGEDSLSEQWSQLTKAITWSSSSLSSGTEYLKTTPPFKKGYFKNNPDKDGKVSLLRVGQLKHYGYYLYKYDGTEISISQPHSWMTDNGEYRRISNCCLFSRRTLPKTIYHIDGDIVNIRIRYLYPPSEQNLIRLYSWPKSFRCFSNKSYRSHFEDFNRVLSTSVFLAIKNEFEQIGYQFAEE